MKKTYFIFLTLLFTSCAKEKTEFQKQISGTWELEATWGGWTGIKTYPAGNGNLFILKSNGVFQFRKKDSLIQQGNYFIEYTNDCSNQKQYFFRAVGHEIEVLSTSNGKLYLTESCIADGGTSIYRKIE